MNSERWASIFELLSTGFLISALLIWAFLISLVTIIFSDDASQAIIGLITAWSSIILAVVAYYSYRQNKKLINEIILERHMQTFEIKSNYIFPELMKLFDKFETGQAIPSVMIPSFSRSIAYVDGELSVHLAQYFDSSYLSHVKKCDKAVEDVQVDLRKKIGPEINRMIQEYFKNDIARMKKSIVDQDRD